MQPLKCELCGGNNLTKIDGLFVCDFCGTKYTPEEARKLMIDGPVEFVTGNAEKERLLQNADQFYLIGEKEKSKEVYQKVTEEFPGEYRGWLGLMKHELDEMPVSLSRADIRELIGLNISGYFNGYHYGQISRFEAIALRLDPSSAEVMDQLWADHDQKHGQWLESLYEKSKNDETFFLQIRDFLYPESFVPAGLRPLFDGFAKNASYLNSFLYPNLQHKFENIEKIASDIYPRGGESRRPGRVESCGGEIRFGLLGAGFTPASGFINCTCRPFRYLTNREAVADDLIIVFNNSYSFDAIKNVLMTDTRAERGIVWANSGKCEICGTDIDELGVCPGCSHLNVNMFGTVGKFILNRCNKIKDKVNLLYEIEQLCGRNAHRNHREGIRFESFSVGDGGFELGYRHYWGSDSVKKASVLIPCVKMRELAVFLSQRKNTSGVCQWCGSSLYGFLRKSCVECGRKKDF